MPSSVKGNNAESDSVAQPAMRLTHIVSGRKIPGGESTFGSQYHSQDGSRAGLWKALHSNHSHSPSHPLARGCIGALYFPGLKCQSSGNNRHRSGAAQDGSGHQMGKRDQTGPLF